MSLDRPPSLSQGRPILDEHAVRYRLAEEVERALRYQRALSILYIDLERPSLEHAQAAMAAASRAIRLSDILGQWEDHGVVVMFPETAEAADIPSSRVLNSICKHIPAARGGTAQCPHHGSDADALLESARQASAIASAGGLATLPHSVEHFSLTDNGPPIVAADPLTKRLFALVRNLSRADLSILISGETGVGKEIVASTLHHWSNRNNGPFVALNCAGIPVSLLESELFGYERGAFSGADGTKPGLIESAAGGTLFLDEISEAPNPIQAKLLRFLETRRIRKLGTTNEISIDVRLVAATNRPLGTAISEGTFRKDLYYRLSAAKIEIPPLRQRRGDIVPLAHRFISSVGASANPVERTFTDAAIERLTAYAWPGNVRELKNVMAYLAATQPDGVIDAPALGLDDRPEDPEAPPSTQPAQTATASTGDEQREERKFRPIKEEIQALEKRRMEEALLASDGVRKEAAALIDMPLRTFVTKLKLYGLGAHAQHAANKKEA